MDGQRREGRWVEKKGGEEREGRLIYVYLWVRWMDVDDRERGQMSGMN